MIMKKLFLSITIAFLGFFSSFAQGNFNAGIHLGIPAGDFSDFFTFNITLDANYLWPVSDTFQAGATLGYSHNFGDSDFGFEDFQFIPLAASARFIVSDKFTVGTDLGYGIVIGEYSGEGGFYYAPKVQYAINESLDVVLAYRGLVLSDSDSIINISFNAITLGVEFEF